MDWLNFIEKIVASLAWPLATIAIIKLLKNEISEILPTLKKFKAGPIEAEFEKEIKELRKTATKNKFIANEPKANYASFREEVINLADVKPSAAILEAWIQIETAARRALKSKSNSVGSSNYIPASKLSTLLLESKLLSPNEAETFNGIRKLRNEVAHAQGFAPTRESAYEYAEIAEPLFLKISSHIDREHASKAYSPSK